MLEHCVSVLDEKGGKNKAFTVYQPVWRMKTLPDWGQGVKTWQGLTASLCISMWMHGWDNKGERGFDLKGFILKERSSWRRKIEHVYKYLSSLSDFTTHTYWSLLSPPSFLTLLMYILIMCIKCVCVQEKILFIKSLCRTSAKISRQYSENTLQGKVRG